MSQELHVPELKLNAQNAALVAELPASMLAGVSAAEFREALAKAITPVTILATDGPSGQAGVVSS